MPVVTVESLFPPDPEAVDRLLLEVPRAIASAISCDAGDVWVYWHAVGAACSGGQLRSFADHSPVVTIRARAWRTDDQVKRGMAAAAAAVASSLGLPLEEVWVHWLELPPGRVYAGGGIR